MHESEGKSIQKNDSFNELSESAKIPTPTRVPAPHRVPVPSQDRSPVENADAGFVWVPPSAREEIPDTPPSYRAKAGDQRTVDPQRPQPRSQGRGPGQRNNPRRGGASGPRQAANPNTVQGTKPPQVYTPQGSSHDWEASFTKKKVMTVQRKRFLDKVIFAIILVAFIGVLIMMIYQSTGGDLGFAVQELMAGRSPFQNLSITPEAEPSSEVVSHPTQEDGLPANINLRPAIPAAPVFPLPVESRSYVVWDVDDETLLFEAAAEELHDPASLTKVMTALVVLRGDTSLDATVTLTAEDFAGFYEAGASMAGFKEGETVTVRDLLYGMLLPSGAEAARALGRHVSGSESEFVTLMNRTAQELGLSKTTFYTSTGLSLDDQSNLTTARDFLTIFREAIEYPVFVEIAGTHMRSLPVKTEQPEGLDLISTFTWRFNSDPEHRSTILAGKSGHSGREQTLVTLATVANKNYIVITLAAPDDEGHTPKAVHDHVVIHNYILDLES